MAIIIDPDDKEKKITVVFSGDDAKMANRHGIEWLADQLTDIVLQREEQTAA